MTTSSITANRPVDKYVLWTVLVLGAVGVLAVYSSVSFLAEARAGDTEQFLLKHLMRLGLGLGAMYVCSAIDYHRLARYSGPALIVSLGLLLVAQMVGVQAGGASRWLKIGPIVFQPSDLTKVALVVYVALLLVKKQEYVKSLGRSFVPLFVWIFLAVLLIGVEDLSTAAVVLATTLLMCFIGRASLLHLTGLAVLGVSLATIMLLSSPERAARLESYLGVKLFSTTQSEQVFDARAEGYQQKQAKIAFAMGGLTGVGPGKSVQRDFLPAPYNDFIYAIIAEEYGMLGALFVLGLFLVLLFRGFMRIARDAPDPLGLLLGVGLTMMVVLYGFIHAGVACGLLPVTGLPLPFVSYGGTAMLANGVMIGMLLNISRQATA